jgi:hypothetical protein
MPIFEHDYPGCSPSFETLVHFEPEAPRHQAHARWAEKFSTVADSAASPPHQP